MIKKTVLGLLAIGLLAVSCSSDDDNNNASTNADLTLNLQGLEVLGIDYVYEGWIIVDGSPQTTGTFTVNDDGIPSSTTFVVPTADLDVAIAFVLSFKNKS